MLKKIFLLPYFGKYPEWMDKWVANMEYLKPMGYDYKIYSNLDLFKERVREVLKIEPNIEYGTGKVWDYRGALGYLYADDIKGYDYWGHTDFDVVYGRVDRYFTDELIAKHDVITNEYRYVCGFWTLYKNCKKVNEVFKRNLDWKKYIGSPEITAWVENSFTKTVNENLNIKYLFEQTQNLDNYDTLRFEDGVLYEGNNEVCTAHFRRTKKYPV